MIREFVAEKRPFAVGFVRGNLTRLAVRVGRPVGEILFNESLLRLAEGYARTWARFAFWRHYFRLTDREWFDHRINQHRWTVDPRSTAWLERGVYPRELMGTGTRVLDLCCGDGFYPAHFFADGDRDVVAVDRDANAVAHARAAWRRPRLRYAVSDVVADPFPGEAFDVVTWDMAIEHFDARDVRTVLGKIAAVLGDDGVLSGSTPLVADTSENPFHQHDFSSEEQLLELLLEFFSHAATHVTEHPERRTMYFRASSDRARIGRFAATTSAA